LTDHPFPVILAGGNERLECTRIEVCLKLESREAGAKVGKQERYNCKRTLEPHLDKFACSVF
jgi:hypothetical protein